MMTRALVSLNWSIKFLFALYGDAILIRHKIPAAISSAKHSTNAFKQSLHIFEDYFRSLFFLVSLHSSTASWWKLHHQKINFFICQESAMSFSETAKRKKKRWEILRENFPNLRERKMVFWMCASTSTCTTMWHSRRKKVYESTCSLFMSTHLRN